MEKINRNRVIVIVAMLVVLLSTIIGLFATIELKTTQTAYAGEEHTHNDVTFTKWTSTTSLPNEAGNYYLTTDVVIESSWDVPTGTTNLCLNGFGIKVSGTDSVIYVENSRTLNIYDCGETTHYFDVYSNGEERYAININETEGNNRRSFVGGYITGGQGKENRTHGGGIYIDGGTCNLYGGNVIGNILTQKDNCGAGVFLQNSATFRMYGGSISYNYAQNAGCAIFAWKNSTVEIRGGEISYNKTAWSYGSAISFYNPNGYTVSLKLYGGFIHDNLTKSGGGAVNLTATGLTVGLKGNLIVQDNATVSTDGNATLNLHVGNKPLNIEGALTNKEKIRLRLASGTGTFTSGWSTYMGDADPADYFYSENEAYKVYLLNGEAAILAEAPVHTHDYSDEWSNDDTNHWHACTSKTGACDAPKKDETAHVYGDDISTSSYYTCSVCGYENATRKSEYDAEQGGGIQSGIITPQKGILVKIGDTIDFAGTYIATANGVETREKITVFGIEPNPLDDNYWKVVYADGIFVIHLNGHLTAIADGFEITDGSGTETDPFILSAHYPDSTHETPPLDPVFYLDENGETQSCTDYTVINENTTNLTEGWYVVSSDVTSIDSISVNGDVKLILCDGKTLTNHYYINCWYYDTDSLTIYVQSTGENMGSLVVDNSANNTNFTAIDVSNVTINGGNIIAKGNSGIEAYELTINGGNITAIALNEYSQGLRADNTIITGGKVFATGQFGIYGPITISGGEVYAEGTVYGFFIFDGNGATLFKKLIEGNISINGGNVTAVGSEQAIYGTVKNSIVGIGWTDVAGTEGEAAISVSSKGQTFDYKKVVFATTKTEDDNILTPKEKWIINKGDKGVVVEIEGSEKQTEITVEVDVKTDVSSKQSQADYSKVAGTKLGKNEKVAFVYDVKLIRTEITEGVETKTEIQPSDIKAGTTIIVCLNVPTELRGKIFKVLHIHSNEDVEFVEFTKSDDGSYITVRTDKLSEFAFIVENSASHTFCIGWVVFIFAILELLYLALYLIIWLPQTETLAKKCKLDKIKQQRKKPVLFGFINLLLLIGLISSCAVWIFTLVALCCHACTISVISFVLATLIFIFFILCLICEWEKNTKNGRTENTEEETKNAIEETENAKDGVGLKESLAMAATATHSENITKAFVKEYLTNKYPDSIEINSRDNFTKTGLPLADTHYVKTGAEKTCFIYVYETKGATMLLLKTKDELGEELTKEYNTVRKSAFPKAKDKWYSVIIDDSFTNEQVKDILDRTIALYNGKTIWEKTVKPIKTVEKVTVAEATSMIDDEVAASYIEVDTSAGSHVGKKDIVNVDTLSENFNDGDTVTLDALKEKKLVPAKSKQIKLLARGVLDKKLHIELQDYSLEAVKMVIAIGGTIKRV